MADTILDSFNAGSLRENSGQGQRSNAEAVCREMRVVMARPASNLCIKNPVGVERPSQISRRTPHPDKGEADTKLRKDSPNGNGSFCTNCGSNAADQFTAMTAEQTLALLQVSCVHVSFFSLPLLPDYHATPGTAHGH